MAAPAISVVMPVYNGARFLRGAVDSVLGQSFADFEFIVVDDGSTDATAALLQQWTDSRLRVVRIEHSGLIPALNRGMELATAPFIARMDADDICEPNRFERQFAYLSNHADVAVLATAAHVIDANGAIVDSLAAFLPRNGLLEFVAGNPIVHGSTMLRRSALPQPVYRAAPEDYHLWLDLLRAGKAIHCLPEPLYRFRKHADSYSIVASRSQSAAVVDVLDWLLANCPTDHPLSRARLLLGWGMLAGYAYRSGRDADASRAVDQFIERTRQPWDDAVATAVDRGIGFAVWGGCPWTTVLRLRTTQLRHRPWSARAYRQWLAALPPVRAIANLASAIARRPKATDLHGRRD